MIAKVSTVLDCKGYRVVTVSPEASVASVARVLVTHRIGAAPVVDDNGFLLGIISERDVVRGISEHGDEALRYRAEQLMTREVRTCSLRDQLNDIMQVMTLQRIRHLPVVENGMLQGIVSIGDVVKQRLDELQLETEELRRYICSS